MNYTTVFRQKKLPKLTPFAGGYEIFHTNFTSTNRQNDKKAERQTYRQKKMKVEP